MTHVRTLLPPAGDQIWQIKQHPCAIFTLFYCETRTDAIVHIVTLTIEMLWKFYFDCSSLLMEKRYADFLQKYEAFTHIFTVNKDNEPIYEMLLTGYASFLCKFVLPFEKN